MQLIKNTQRAQVCRTYTGTVTKMFSGPNKRDRFRNEIRILSHLNSQDCPFVPKLISHDEQSLTMTTSYAGEPVQSITTERLESLFEELEAFGVRHDDPAQRNVLYNHALGRFTLIDFEFAEILSGQTTDSFSEIDARFDQLEEQLELAGPS